MVRLTRDLVRIPSRGGVDPYDQVLDYMSAWLGEHGLACRRLTGPGGTTVALTCEVPRTGSQRRQRAGKTGSKGTPRHAGPCVPSDDGSDNSHRLLNRTLIMDNPAQT